MDEPEIDPTKLNEPGASGYNDAVDETIYLSPISSTSVSRLDEDEKLH